MMDRDWTHIDTQNEQIYRKEKQKGKFKENGIEDNQEHNLSNKMISDDGPSNYTKLKSLASNKRVESV